MPKSALSAAVARVGRAVAPDGPLLTRYARTKDPDAFAALVERHGPMVRAVCRRTAGDDHSADDAFQAAFLVLARRAADVIPASALRGWLYGVAVRTAREARVVSARRRSREVPVAVVPDHPSPPTHEPDADALRALDEEVAALPEHLRAAVVLCELDGLPRAEAAARLGVPEGTLSSRLAKARKVLAARLTARGVLPAAAGLAVLFDRAAAPAAVGPGLAGAAVALASCGPIPVPVADLSRKVFASMFLTKVKRAAVALIAVAAAGLTGSMLWPAKAEPPVTPTAAKATVSPNRLLICTSGGLSLVDPDAPALTGQGPVVAEAFMGYLSPDGARLAVNLIGGPIPKTGHPEFTPTVRRLDKSKPDHVVAKLDPDAPVPPLCSVWSPDGKQLIIRQPMTRSNPSGTYDVEKWFRYDPDTGKAEPVLLPKRHVVADWSRDGKWLLTWGVFAREDGQPTSRVARVPVAGGEPEFLTSEKVLALPGRLSPDGSKLLFTSQRLDGGQPDGHYYLYVMDLKDRKPVRVADPEKGDVAGLGCCWSPDGKRIAYVRSKPFYATKKEDEGCNFAVVVANADGSNPKVVAARSLTGEHATASAGITLTDWR